MSNTRNEVSTKAKEVLGVGWCGLLATWLSVSKQAIRNRLSRGESAGIEHLLDFIKNNKKDEKIY